MAEIDVLKAQLVRNDANTPWGFRLQGGADSSAPLTIARIRPGSPAARIGLKEGDEVTEIGDTSTTHLTHQQANDIIKQFGLSLILTVERRARGAAPRGPQVMQTSAPPPMASYQPYDMTGKPAPVSYAPAVRLTQRPRAEVVPPNVECHTAQARVFEAPPPRHVPRYQPPPPEPAPAPVAPMAVDGHYGYVPEEDKLEEGPVQSRTFKILQSLMQNEEPHAGSAGLPPPRSATMEQWKAEQAAKRQSPRVQVFMPQTYNTPLGLYTTENIMNTFQQQAGAHMDQMDQYEDDPLSGTQRAVLEEDSNAGGGSDL